jgi:uncharacterized membrane protein
MTQQKPTAKLIERLLQLAVYVVGGVILLAWLFATPAGLWGKADAIGYAVCHRIDVRSFHIGLRQIPLCARCTGQYLGAVIGLGFLSIYSRRRSGMPSRRVLVALIILAVIYGIDGLNSYFYLPPFVKLFPGMPHLYQPSNTLRLFTGTGMGILIAMLLYPAFWGSVITNPDPQPAVKDLRILFIIIGLGVLADLLILSGSKYVLVPAALISTFGVVLLLTMVYTIIWLRILRKENTFSRLSQITRYIIVGFFFAMVQIALLDLIRFIITGTWNGLFFG